MQLRMQTAQELLRSGRSIKEVVIMLNYSSSSAFCSAFKNYTGQTPAKWYAGQ
jgi:AraC-like DNA-binding protein